MSAVAVVSVIACDKCSAQPAVTWAVRAGEEPARSIDLCADCSAPLRQLLTGARPATGTRKRGITKSPVYRK